ncbi:MAG: prepilin-type N-terminal cleavage/methylation domain-containing protein [Candidatus Doudnabacteria bacterium]|nr:prepilin-type N-terminal cleavage/methylation domain-containing protein [Candidatus Doudnabacteria bacterium]
MRNKNQSGFTLIELLVVIAIIGLLASVVLLALNGARAKSRDAKRIADVRQIASAMELFYNDNNSYPSYTSNLVPNYIGVWPTAPTPVDPAAGATTGCTASNNSYTLYPGYNAGGTPSSSTYALVFCLGGLTGGYGPGQHTLSQSGIQ